MSALVLDAGALVAVDRDDRAMIARLRAAQQQIERPRPALRNPDPNGGENRQET